MSGIKALYTTCTLDTLHSKPRSPCTLELTSPGSSMRTEEGERMPGEARGLTGGEWPQHDNAIFMCVPGPGLKERTGRRDVVSDQVQERV